MNTSSIGKNISELRRKKGATQEELAKDVGVSAQAVSKWENGGVPDTELLPQIAKYFGVSIDSLFCGEGHIYEDIYAANLKKVIAYPQMSAEAYEEVLKILNSAHHGLFHGGFGGDEPGKMCDEPCHISNENGLSLVSGKGFGAAVTRKYFANITRENMGCYETVLSALAGKNCLLVVSAVISMSDISFDELREKTGLSAEELRAAVDTLVKSELLTEKKSKHETLGFTYEISSMYHTCICVMLAILEMQRQTLDGISCCMGYGDYPISL